jgi:hypothetical protein
MRDRAEESYGEVIKTYGNAEYKKRASGINKEIIATTDNIKTIIFQRALSQHWDKSETLKPA